MARSQKHIESTTRSRTRSKTFDLRCPHKYDIAHFHNIIDCLVPSYNVVELARNAIGMRCFVGTAKLGSTLRPLVADFPNSFIPTGTKCINDVLHYTRPLWEAGQEDWAHMAPTQEAHRGKSREEDGARPACLGFGFLARGRVCPVPAALLG